MTSIRRPSRTRTRIRIAALLAVALGLLAAATPSAPARTYVPDSEGRLWSQGDGSVRTVGKIVSVLPGDEIGLCSGAVVDSGEGGNGSVVATAAHCISDPHSPRHPREAYFVPEYDRLGQTDLARIRDAGWRVTGFHEAPGWNPGKQRLEEILPHDWGFLTVERKDGRTLQQSQGANTLAYAPDPTHEHVAALGYPAQSPYDGEALAYCAGPAPVARPDEYAAANVGSYVMDGCDLTQGASGGPWMRGFDQGSESGTVVAVSTVGEWGTLLGRPFPREARGVLADAGR
ncbi:hypothetical protein E0L36_19515 [Streptomyces sp. AJS327]|uniref:trypsin-like serine peptidase n=1 Tax=Streptomyces sp. AJS327 TaxID=2545265 RepID=UPI0015E0381F|nr:trypsin-like peptidase domain-containing protein [Streptomyces sp. AJS327]MBA0052983.1 hypothetical protein [Streptomyces sp. AJS327]